jgi:hypothetical protein
MWNLGTDVSRAGQGQVVNAVMMGVERGARTARDGRKSLPTSYPAESLGLAVSSQPMSELPPNARALAAYMSELSEMAYSAGWMRDLEYALWQAVVEGPRRYGHLTITDAHVLRLKSLATSAGGWIVFDDVLEESLVPTDTWARMYQAWIAGTGGREA